MRRTAVMPMFKALPVFALLLALTACDPGPGPTPGPTSPAAPGSPTPTAGPTGGPAAFPQSRYDFGCADLVDPSLASAILGATVAERDPIDQAMVSESSIPTASMIETLGGVACEWSNGEPAVVDHSPSSTYRGIRLWALPDAAAQWMTYRSTYSLTTDHELNCFSDAVARCYHNQLVGGTWIEVLIDGVADTASPGAAVVPVLDPIASAFLEATVGPAPEAPAGAPLPSGCEALLTAAEFTAATGIGSPLIGGGPHGGWSLGAAASEEATGGFPCIYFFADADAFAGVTHYLPWGAWAADHSMRAATYPSAAAAVDVAGADRAWQRCAPGDAWCIVDVVVGDHWLQLELPVPDFGLPGAADPRAASLAAAAVLAANAGR